MAAFESCLTLVLGTLLPWSFHDYQAYYTQQYFVHNINLLFTEIDKNWQKLVHDIHGICSKSVYDNIYIWLIQY